MATNRDILRGSGTGHPYNPCDLSFKNGDFAVGDSDSQHVQDTITAYAGWWKQYPADGVGLQSYVNGSGNFQKLAKNIKLQLQKDGYTVNPLPSITFNNGNLEINPNAYKL